MKTNLKKIKLPAGAENPDRFYAELTSRNRHFVPFEVQDRLRNLRILIAGCGSTGGACTQPLARLGVTQLALADNGAYELNNLNRQHAFLENIGENKARFHAASILQINPFAELIVDEKGITRENVSTLTEWADLIMDAVDVTTPSGISAKLDLHESAKASGKPVLTALDIGFCQWGESFDYRDPEIAVLKGRLKKARDARHPLKALFMIAPIGAVPPHALPLIRDLLQNAELPASQLGGTSDLLSGIIASAVIRFATDGELVKGWDLDLASVAMPLSQRIQCWFRAPVLRREISRLLRSVE